MHIDTSSLIARDLVNEALMDIEHYKHSKEPTRLRAAKDKLEEARVEDPDYIVALYYGAMVNDLLGRAADAIDQLTVVMSESPPFVEEVRYHLGVACYHRYTRDYLEQAAEHFMTVISNTPDSSSLNLLAHAGLAQTCAMRMIQPDPLNPDRDEARLYFDRVRLEYDLVMKRLEAARMDEGTVNEIRWAAHNARGMSLIYHSDHFGTLAEKESQLNEGLMELEQADSCSPQNWANYCDLGSAHMRLGYWLKIRAHFEEALNRLNQVVTSLRPNYGFAMYEIGRTFRLMGRFEDAIEYFNKALETEYKYRDVSDKRINFEKDRAQKASTDYP